MKPLVINKDLITHAGAGLRETAVNLGVNTTQKLSKTKKLKTNMTFIPVFRKINKYINELTKQHFAEHTVFIVSWIVMATFGKTVELGFLSEADFLQNMCTRQLFTFTGGPKTKTYHRLIWLCALISIVYNKKLYTHGWEYAFASRKSSSRNVCMYIYIYIYININFTQNVTDALLVLI